MKELTDLEIINYLREISLKQGEHNGRWENEYIMEYSTQVYYDDMTDIADELGIEYAKDEEFQKELEEYNDEHSTNILALDNWVFDLRQKMERMLLKKLKM